MEFNQNLYNNYQANNFTFRPNFMPPFCVPPPFYMPPQALTHAPLQNTDEDFVKSFEVNLPLKEKRQKPLVSISALRVDLRNLVSIVNAIKNKEKFISENMVTLSEDEWTSVMEEIERGKESIKEYFVKINNLNLDVSRKLIAKRSAKRMRLKRLRLEKKKAKEDMIKQANEKSRKIDENLQKIKDDVTKAKQEEEAKLQADVVLKEVLRKKSDAKKCLVKLDALMKLRKARQNTAKGRGENISERDVDVFNSNIEKLKSLWSQRLVSYEKEESELRDKLKQDSDEQVSTNDRENQVLENLMEWRECLFGGADAPQVDFSGDIGRFIAVRSQWDQFVSNNGSPLPVGWVLPSTKTP